MEEKRTLLQNWLFPSFSFINILSPLRPTSHFVSWNSLEFAGWPPQYPAAKTPQRGYYSLASNSPHGICSAPSPSPLLLPRLDLLFPPSLAHLSPSMMALWMALNYVTLLQHPGQATLSSLTLWWHNCWQLPCLPDCQLFLWQVHLLKGRRTPRIHWHSGAL